MIIVLKWFECVEIDLDGLPWIEMDLDAELPVTGSQETDIPRTWLDRGLR